MQFRRRHHVFLVFAQDALDQGALLGIARYDGRITALKDFAGARGFVEAETSLATLISVGTVTAITTVGEDRAHLAVEIHPRLRD